MDRSVPLFSDQLGEGIIMGGLLWSLFFKIILFFMDVRIDILYWLIFTLIAGFLLLALWNFLKWKRFYNPVTNQELLRLFEEVKQDLGKDNIIELWYRDIDRQVFLSSSSLFFKAILFSESAIADILKKPEKGKVLLAREILELEKKRSRTRYLIGVLGFTLFSFIESIAFLNFLDLVVFSFEGMMITIVVIIVTLLILGPLMASIKNKETDKTLEELYGLDAEAAQLEVFTGLSISDEMLEEIKHDEEEGPSRKRIALRNASIALFIVFPFTFLLFTMLGLFRVLNVMFSLIMALLAGAGTFVIVFMISFVWPLLSMGRGERSHEWDIQLPFAEEVQSLLHQEEGLSRLMVKAVKSPFDDDFGLVILQLNPDYSEETVHAVMPSTLQILKEPEFVVPLIIVEIRRDEFERQERKIGYVVLGIAFPFLAIGIIWSFMTSGVFDILANFLWILFIYLLITFIPIGIMTYWRRRRVVETEVDIARRYPRYLEALQILITNHQMLPFGKTSYKKRLEHVMSHIDSARSESFRKTD